MKLKPASAHVSRLGAKNVHVPNSVNKKHIKNKKRMSIASLRNLCVCNCGVYEDTLLDAVDQLLMFKYTNNKKLVTVGGS